MFTGIIETIGWIRSRESEGGNVHFQIESEISHTLHVDQSVSHNGVCLTITAQKESYHQVTAIEETLLKSNLMNLQSGQGVNLERCMPATGRFDGHIVQGHVDQTALCIESTEHNGSWVYRFEVPVFSPFFTVEKGSVCVNGVSLTVVHSTPHHFSVAIIPYTYQHTTFKDLHVGDSVNLEFDIIGKYIAEVMRRRLE